MPSRSRNRNSGLIAKVLANRGYLEHSNPATINGAAQIEIRRGHMTEKIDIIFPDLDLDNRIWKDIDLLLRAFSPARIFWIMALELKLDSFELSGHWQNPFSRRSIDYRHRNSSRRGREIVASKAREILTAKPI